MSSKMHAAQHLEPISKLLDTLPKLIYRVEEWAKVFFVCVKGYRPTFVSKKAIIMSQDFRDYLVSKDYPLETIEKVLKLFPKYEARLKRHWDNQDCPRLESSFNSLIPKYESQKKDYLEQLEAMQKALAYCKEQGVEYPSLEEYKKVLSICKNNNFIENNPVKKSTIEFVQGNEWHSSYWGKFYVKGLEDYEVKEEFEENARDKHHSYQGFVCLDIPDDTVFTIFEQSGTKHGTDTYYFLVCRTDSSLEKSKLDSDYGSGYLEGSFEIIAEGKGKTKAPRLMKWWIDSERKDLEYARHCGEYIKKRGVKVPPAMS